MECEVVDVEREKVGEKIVATGAVLGKAAKEGLEAAGKLNGGSLASAK